MKTLWPFIRENTIFFHSLKTSKWMQDGIPERHQTPEWMILTTSAPRRSVRRCSRHPWDNTRSSSCSGTTGSCTKRFPLSANPCNNKRIKTKFNFSLSNQAEIKEIHHLHSNNSQFKKNRENTNFPHKTPCFTFLRTYKLKIFILLDCFASPGSLKWIIDEHIDGL